MELEANLDFVVGNLSLEFCVEDPGKPDAGSFIAECIYQYLVSIVDVLFAEIFQVTPHFTMLLY